MRHRLYALAVLLIVGAGFSQQRGADLDSLRFEVASIKAVPEEPHKPIQNGPSPGGLRWVAPYTLVASLISQAYGVRYGGVEGEPDWVRRDYYDVEAKAERPSTDEELRAMLRNLLADRFQLRAHHETRQLPVFRLEIDKGGPKLKPSAVQGSGNPAIREEWGEFTHLGSWNATSMSMELFARRISVFVDLDRPVIDETGLAGDFDFDFQFVEDVGEERAARAASKGRPINPHPTIFEALSQQLGLRLVAGKGPVDFLVVDHVERPTPN